MQKFACKLTEHLKDLAHRNHANTDNDTMGTNLVKTINTSNFLKFPRSITYFIQLQHIHIGHTQTISVIQTIIMVHSLCSGTVMVRSSVTCVTMSLEGRVLVPSGLIVTQRKTTWKFPKRLSIRDSYPVWI